MFKRYPILSLLFMALPGFAGEPPPLQDALWRGELTIRVNGTLLSQMIGNQMGGDLKSVPIGFSKEKGVMELDLRLTLLFLVNALGEVSVIADDQFKGTQTISGEFHREFTEEKQVEKTRMKFQQKVRSSERRNANVAFFSQETYGEDPFPLGEFRVVPSGRMNRRGKLRLVGDLALVYRGSGDLEIIEERTPPSDEFGRKKTKANLSRSFRIPIKIDQTVDHRKKPVEGSIAVAVPLTNPFKSLSEVEGRRDIFKPNITASGTYRLTPLF